MNVTLKATVHSEPGGEAIYQQDVRLEAIAMALQDILPDGTYGWPRLVAQFIPDARVALDRGASLGLIEPQIYRRWITKEWQVFRLGEGGIYKSYWLFYHLTHGQFQYVPMPQGCKIGPDGAITCEFEEYTASFKTSVEIDRELPNDDGWPWVLLNPRVWVALDQLEKIVDSGETNLNALVTTSAQPYRKVARDLKVEIQQAIRMLTESLTNQTF